MVNTSLSLKIKKLHNRPIMGNIRLKMFDQSIVHLKKIELRERERSWAFGYAKRAKLTRENMRGTIIVESLSPVLKSSKFFLLLFLCSCP